MTTAEASPVQEELRPDRLLDAARAEAGLEDYGDLSFVEPMNAFLAAAVKEASLNALGVMAVKMDTIRFLANRLRFVADLARHPEILDEDVSDPIVITGLPRTGTSKLQRMISSDPNVQPLLVWRLLNPAPMPGGGDPDPRIAIAQGFEGMLQNFPEFQAAHPTRALEVDEDLLLHEMTFDSVVLTFRARMPSYLKWVRERPVAPAYDWAKQMLQYLQWQDGGARGRPWVLKTPVHVGNLDSVLRCFPRATVVHCHRDPTTVIASFAKAVEASRRICSDSVDRAELGAEQVEIWADAIEANLAQRTSLTDRLTVVDVSYELIRSAPHEAIRQVYAAAGRAHTDEAEKHMDTWAAENPQHRFGNHTYALEDYRVSPEQIRARFAAYIEHFGHLL